MDEWLNKMWEIRTVVCSSGLKKEGNPVICYNGMNLEGIMLSEVGQLQKTNAI